MAGYAVIYGVHVHVSHCRRPVFISRSSFMHMHEHCCI